jgi:serine/threonine-protein kinase
MSRVFLAEEARFGRRVVVKVLAPELTEGMSAERFEREVRLAARLQHPNIVPVLTAGERDGLAYFTMPYVEGESLRALMVRDGRIPVDTAVWVLRDVARALEYAHAHGVMHRDIKPDNILLAGSAATVADFGIAKAIAAASARDGPEHNGAPATLTQLGMLLGTPTYMAPEQAVGDPDVDSRADIYAWGVVAFELFAGAPPFAGRSTHQLVAAHIGEPPPSLAERAPGIPPALAALVMRCLEKDPARRPQTAGELLTALDAARTPSGQQIEATSAVASNVPRRRTRVAAAASAAIGVLLVLLATVATRWTGRSAAATRPVLAVLPFENLGPAADAYFADGLTDEVTTRLARVSGLQVIGRASARQYNGSTKAPREIARELGATYLLTGTVRWERSADGAGQVRVSPALLRASDQSTVWAAPYEGPLRDVFRVQSDVAERVAAALDVTLLADERRVVTARPTANLGAYDAYLRGLAASSRSGRYSVAGRRTAVAELERAVALDPGFAAAHSALALAYIAADVFVGDPALVSKARASVDRADALAPDRMESQLARAAYLVATGDLEGALRAAESAARQAPDDPAALYYLAQSQSVTGHFEDAVATAQRAERIDPRSSDPPATLAGAYAALGRHEDEIQAREREIALSPDNVIAYAVQAASYLIWRADTVAARRMLERASPSLGTAVLMRLPDLNVAQGLWSAALPPAVLRAKDTLTFAGYASTGDSTRELYHFMKLRHYARAGRLDLARAHADSVVRVLDPALRGGAAASTRSLWRFSRQEMLAEAYAIGGRRAEAGRVIDRFAADGQSAPNAFDPPFVLATGAYVDVLLGRRDSAVARLTELLSRPASGLVISRALLRADPAWAPLRGHPGFERLIAGGA